jgi:hypothetical protein
MHFVRVIRNVFENARNGIFQNTKSYSVWVRIRREWHTRYNSHVTRRQSREEMLPFQIRLNVSGKSDEQNKTKVPVNLVINFLFP